MVVHKLFVVSLAFLMTALLPSVSPGRAAEPEFTPLDEIARVRQAGWRPLELELSYIWESARQPAIADREIEVKLRVGTDTARPEVALIAMQRPFPVRPHGIIGSTALMTQIFPYGAHDGSNGHGELPPGDLLDYAAAYDTLGWTLIRPSDRLGGNTDLARGTPDPKARCQRVLWPDTTRSRTELADKARHAGLIS